MAGFFASRPLPFRLVFMALGVCFLLVVLHAQRPLWFEPMHKTTDVILAPLQGLSTYLYQMHRHVQGLGHSKEALQRDNARLKIALDEANARLNQTDYLRAQNARLKSITHAPLPHAPLLLANVLSSDASVLSQSLILDKGAQDGVQIGASVIDDRGLLGQIVSVTATTSRLMLLTDESQAVAIYVARTGQRAIVSGDKSGALTLDYVFKTADVVPGDVLISSGLGGRFPPGYRVGQVLHINTTQTDNFAAISVAPSAHFAHPVQVFILGTS